MTKANSVVSEVSGKSQMVLPGEVRDGLRVGPGDRVRFILDPDSIRIEKETVREGHEPFASFSEWSSEADEEAHGDL